MNKALEAVGEKDCPSIGVQPVCQQTPAEVTCCGTLRKIFRTGSLYISHL